MSASQMTTTEMIRANRKIAKARYYRLNSILGNQWAIFYVIIGGRKTGKSYAGAEFLINHQNDKNYWLRISETSTKAMLAGNCKGLVDPDLQKYYGLDLKSKGGMYVYNHGKDFCTIAPLSSFGKLKGVGFYDKNYDGWYNIFMDEFQLEQGERKTSFDILYNFIGMCENLVRTTKSKIRVFLFGNTLEEASTILKAFNFLPEKFGRFYLKRKRCVIDNIEPTEEYLEDRKGSIADILGGDKMSNYTNRLKKDVELIDKSRTTRPQAIIKFSKSQGDWYTMWDGGIIKRYNNEKLPHESDFAMRPYIGTYYSKERKQAIIDMFDARALRFNNLITQAYFQDSLASIRKQ